MIYSSFSLNGTWEMIYQEDKYTKTESPEQEVFADSKGDCIFEKAVPGYWEDMAEKFALTPYFGKLKINPKTTAHKGGKKEIFLTAVLTVPPNFKIKTKDNIRNMHNVAISQKIALKNPSEPYIPNVTGYPINAVLAIITVTNTLHKVTSSKSSRFKIK